MRRRVIVITFPVILFERHRFYSFILLALLASWFSAGAQDVSVDPLSGNAVVTIPLHTLKYGSIAVPVNLVHSSNALMVQESEGDAGFGWNLSCNYGVYRQVRGLPDDVNVASSKLGWLTYGPSIKNFNPTSNDNTADWTDESADFGVLNNCVGVADTEPDIYTISAPNLYARFIYDGDGTTIRLLEYQDIQVTALSSANGFTVRNNLGHVYQFTVKQRVTRKAEKYKEAVIDMLTTEYDYYKDSGVPQFTSTWYLASVTDENGNTVNFNYTAQATTKSARFKTRVTTITNSPDTLYTVVDDLIPQALSSITAGNYTVAFDWGKDKQLSGVKVSEPGFGDSYQYGFTYLAARDITWGGGGPQYLHYFLTEIELVSPTTCLSEVPYIFSYEGVGNGTSGVKSVDFSWQKLFAQDFWGFYNGVVEVGSNSYLNVIPRLNFYNSLTDSRRFTFHDIPGQTATATLNATNRNTKADKVGIGTLFRITYPSGGYTRIEWERNKYLDSLAGKVLYGPGLRVRSLTTSGGDAAYNRNATTSKSYHDVVKTYKYEKSETDTTTSGIILYPPSYGFLSGTTTTEFVRTLDNQAPESQIAYRRIKESISGYGSKVCLFLSRQVSLNRLFVGLDCYEEQDSP